MGSISMSAQQGSILIFGFEPAFLWGRNPMATQVRMHFFPTGDDGCREAQGRFPRQI